MATLNEGQLFERYRIIRCLGSGTSGDSYEAQDTVLHRRVTFKLIHPWGRLADAALRQFFRDMQGMSVITHPSIAATLDYGEWDGILYVARRYVSAGSLLNNEGRAWFRPPLAIADTIRLIHQLAQALAHIHSHGYVHAALTFSNMLVLHSPHLDNGHNASPFLLADTGLAHFIRRFGHPRIAHMPITAAPEQFGGRVTAASDQYALAVIAYFWLTGRLPFLGSTEEVEQMKRTETIAPLTLLNSQIQATQESILRRALCAAPDERFPSILAFANALQATLPASHSTLSPQKQPASERVVVQISPDPNQPPIPDVPQPMPLPEQEPQPLPEPGPAPMPEPTPEPQPEPEILPQPEPDIPPPLPDPQREPIPEPDQPMAEHAASAIVNIPHLLIVSPHTADTRSFLLLKEETTLGHAGSSDVLLDQDDFTSRHHALIQRKGETYLLYDQRSTHGVTVNDQQLEPEVGYILTDGDRINIGSYQLTFHAVVRTESERLRLVLTEHPFAGVQEASM